MVHTDKDEVVRDAWDVLVEEHYQRIFRFCAQLLGKHGSQAGDATQQTFLKAWKSRGSLKEMTAARGWLYQIARNECYDRLRVGRRFLTFLKDAFANSDPLQNAALPQTPISSPLKRAIEMLPLRQREVFLLRHLHEFSTAEVAEALNINQGTVKAHLKRAVDSLRRGLAIENNESTNTSVSPSKKVDEDEYQEVLR